MLQRMVRKPFHRLVREPFHRMRTQLVELGPLSSSLRHAPCKTSSASLSEYVVQIILSPCQRLILSGRSQPSRTSQRHHTHAGGLLIFRTDSKL